MGMENATERVVFPGVMTTDLGRLGVVMVFAEDHVIPSLLVDTAYPLELIPVATNNCPFHAISIAPPDESNIVLEFATPDHTLPSLLYNIV